MLKSIHAKDERSEWTQSLRWRSKRKKIWSICQVTVCVRIFNLNRKQNKKSTGEHNTRLMHVHCVKQWWYCFFYQLFIVLLKIRFLVFWHAFLVSLFVRFLVLCHFLEANCWHRHPLDWYEIQYFSAQRYGIFLFHLNTCVRWPSFSLCSAIKNFFFSFLSTHVP